MGAARIARVLSGIPTADGGFICRCPVSTHGSGRGDRRPSLSLRDGHSRLLVKCFSGCDVRDVLAELRRMDLLQARDENDDPLTNSERPHSAKRINKNKASASSASLSKTAQHRAEVTKDDYKRRQREKAEWLWSQRRPIIGTVAERYLCARGYYGPVPQTIAFLPARDPYPPACVWAAASASRMPALGDTVPSYVETVTIFAHPDKVGQDKARELASKLHGRGLEVFVEGIAP